MLPKKLILALLAIPLIIAFKALSQETKASSEQTKSPYIIQRLSGSITFYGLSNEEAWKLEYFLGCKNRTERPGMVCQDADSSFQPSFPG